MPGRPPSRPTCPRGSRRSATPCLRLRRCTQDGWSRLFAISEMALFRCFLPGKRRSTARTWIADKFCPDCHWVRLLVLTTSRRLLKSGGILGSIDKSTHIAIGFVCSASRTRPTSRAAHGAIIGRFCPDCHWVRLLGFQRLTRVKEGDWQNRKICPYYQWVRLLGFGPCKAPIDCAYPSCSDEVEAMIDGSPRVEHRCPRLVFASSSIAILVVGGGGRLEGDSDHRRPTRSIVSEFGKRLHPDPATGRLSNGIRLRSRPRPRSREWYQRPRSIRSAGSSCSSGWPASSFSRPGRERLERDGRLTGLVRRNPGRRQGYGQVWRFGSCASSTPASGPNLTRIDPDSGAIGRLFHPQ